MQTVLNAEIKKWSAKSCAQLVAELLDIQAYELEFEGKKYQVEIQLLENTDKYVHIGVDVDDGSIHTSFHPLSSSFMREKEHPAVET
jgi:thiamine biosynthesis lipoprotein ApbE